MNWSLKTNFNSIINIIVLITIAFTMAMTYYPIFLLSKENTKDLGMKIVDQVAIKGKNTVHSFFDNMANNVLNLKALFEEKIVSLNEKEKIQSLFLKFLLTNEEVNQIAFAFSNGDFISVEKNIFGEIKLVNTRYVANNKKVSNQEIAFYEVNKNNQLVRSESRKTISDFSPLNKDWYKNAINSKDSMVWSAAYVSKESRSSQIDISLPHIDKDNNKFYGVFKVSIQMNSISQFIQSLHSSENGDTFIINNKRDTIFSTNILPTIVQDSQGNLTFTKIQAINNNSRIFTNALNDRSIKSDKTFSYTNLSDNVDYFISISPLKINNWSMGIVVPQEDFLKVINENNEKTLKILPFIIIFIIVLVIIVNRFLIGRVLQSIYLSSKLIQKFEIEEIEKKRLLDSSVVKELDTLATSMNMIKTGLVAFSKYLPKQIVKDVLQGNIKAEIGGEHKEVTIFFSDIANFTKTSETLGSKLFETLEIYFDKLSGILIDNNANIDKYIGDAIMAFWNAPADNKMHALDACKAAVKCHRSLEKLQHRWAKENKPLLETRFGLHTGEVLVGNMGGEYKMDYTVLGDNVNLASRLEGLNKLYKTHILISEDTYAQAKADVIVRLLDKVTVKGKTEPTKIYELLGLVSEYNTMNEFCQDWVEAYEKGFSLYSHCQFDEAIVYFKKAIKLRNDKDFPSELMIKRSLKLKSMNIKQFDGVLN